MASKREFEMLFALNARMNGGFSGTFSKAQAEFTRLGKEIQGLHRVQGDIASYQKQQSAIESTRSKLESLQKQHGLLQREIEETGGSTAGLEREKVKLEERIKNTEAALERQNQKLGTTGERLKAAGVDTGNLAQKDAELTAKIKELRGYFEQMTEAERVANAQAIAGQRGYNGLLAILNATDADYASLTNSINNCTGAAQRMANVKLDNLNGQLTLMDSAWDALRVTIGEQFAPELRGLAELGTDVLGWINGFVQENPALVKGLMAAAGAIGAGVAALTGVVTVTKVLIPLMSALTAATPGVNIIVGITALTAAVAGLAASADDSILSVRDLTEAARDMQDAMDEASASYQETSTQTMATAEVASIYIGKLEEIEAATGGVVEGNQEYQNILGLLVRTVPGLSDCISETTDEYGRATYVLETTTEALRQNTEAWKKNAEAQAYQEYIDRLYDQYGEVMTEAAENSIKLTQAQTKLDDTTKKRDAAMARMNELDLEAYENNAKLTDEYFELQMSTPI